MDWSTIFGISGGIAGLIGVAVSVINAVSSARKSAVENQSRIINDLVDAYERLRGENEGLRSELDALKEQYNCVLLWAVPRGYRVEELPTS